MKGHNKSLQGQTIDKTMAKPAGVVKNHEKTIIQNKALQYTKRLSQRLIIELVYIGTKCVEQSIR